MGHFVVDAVILMNLPFFDDRLFRPPDDAVVDVVAPPDELFCLEATKPADDKEVVLPPPPDLLLRLNNPEKYPALSDSIRVVFPTALCPNTFIFILGMGYVEGMSCSMYSSQQDSFGNQR